MRILEYGRYFDLAKSTNGRVRLESKTNVTIEDVVVCDAVPTSQMYKPNEPITIFVTALGKKDICKISILNSTDDIVITDEIQLSRYGLGMFALDSLPIGSYKIIIDCGGTTNEDDITFQVAEYVRNLFQAELISKELVDNEIEYKVSLKTIPNKSYNGKVKVNVAGVSFNTTIQDGILTGTVNASDDEDVTLLISDEDGNTVQVFIPNSTKDAVARIKLNNFGHKYEAQLGSAKDAMGEIHGLSVFKSEILVDNDASFEIENPVLRDGKTTARISFKNIDKEKYEGLCEVRVKTYNPFRNGEVAEKSFTDLEDGYVDFEVSEPACFFTVGASNGKTFCDGYGTIFSEQAIDVKLKVPETIEPRKSFTVTATANKDTDAFLLVKPKVTTVNYMSDRIPKALKAAVEKTVEDLENREMYSEVKTSGSIHTSGGRGINTLLRSALYETNEDDHSDMLLGATMDMMSPAAALGDSDDSSLYSANVTSYSLDAMSTPNAVPRPTRRKMSKAMSPVLDSMEVDALLSCAVNAAEEIAEEFVIDREENNSVIFAGFVELKKGEDTEIKIEGIEDIGELDVTLFTVKGFSWRNTKATVVCDKEDCLIVNFPTIISETPGISKGEVFIKSKKSNITLEHIRYVDDRPIDIQSLPIDANTSVTIALEKAGTYGLYLKDENGKILDSFTQGVSVLTKDKVSRSTWHMLDKVGDKLSGKLTVLPSITEVQKGIAESLYAYPHGCAEQTLAGLCANATLYKGFLTGAVVEDETFNKTELKKRIKTGLAIVAKYQTEQFQDYLWGYYDKSYANVPITVQCLSHMEPFYANNGKDENPLRKEFPEVTTWVQGTVARLKQEGLHDNRLVWADDCFAEEGNDKGEYKSIASAASLAFYEGDIQAFNWLMKNTSEELNEIHWGNIYDTLLAAKTVWLFKKEMFPRVWNHISSKIENNRLYGTHTSAALISLVSYIGNSNLTDIKIDNHIVKNPSTLDGPVNCVSVEMTSEGAALVKEDRIDEIDYAQLENKAKFGVSGLVSTIKSAKNMKLNIKSKTKDGTMVARVVTTGNLIFANGNAAQLKKELPLINGEAEFVLQSAKKGDNEIFILVYDMYDQENIGTYPVKTVTVT